METTFSPALQITLLALGVITSALATVIISMLNAMRQDLKDARETMEINEAKLHKLELHVSDRFVKKQDLEAIIAGIVRGLRGE